MLSSKAELLSTLDKVKDVSLLVVGDLILDRYIWGKVQRICPEAPVPVVNVTTVEDRLGGAGNVVRNLRGVGAKVNVCGFVGDDEDGQIVLKLLEEYGVNGEGVIIDRSCATSVKTRVIAHSQQVVRIDREGQIGEAQSLQEGFAAVVESQLNSVEAVILSDYAKGTLKEPIMRRLRDAYKAGKLNLKNRPLVLDPKPANYDLYAGVSVATPNRKEAEIAVGFQIKDEQSALKAGRVLLELWQAEMILITLGEDGMMIVSEDAPDGVSIDTVAREVFDVSGAGDTVAAIFSAALAAGASPFVAGDLANIAAGIVVSEVGTVEIEHDKLVQKIETLS